MELHRGGAAKAGPPSMRELFLVPAWPARISDAREVLLQKIIQGFAQILGFWDPCGIRQLGECRDLVGRIVRHDLDLLPDFHWLHSDRP